MRGTRYHARLETPEAGIIPAYAGNTQGGSVVDGHERDHPRVCGEHEGKYEEDSDMPGSSPRMRGTPGYARPRLPSMGIIPAYAGNTYAATSTGVACGDHPRVCGEHLCWAYWRVYALGSSPRMRGTLRNRLARWLVPGIIPAYAGNTVYARVRIGERRDHPRVCGEH